MHSCRFLPLLGRSGRGPFDCVWSGTKEATPKGLHQLVRRGVCSILHCPSHTTSAPMIALLSVHDFYSHEYVQLALACRIHVLPAQCNTDCCRFMCLFAGPFYRNFSNEWLEVADNLTAHQQQVDTLLTGLIPETIATAPSAAAALTATMLELMNWARHAQPIVAHVVQQQQYLSCPYYLPRVKPPSNQPQCMDQVLEWLEQGACWNYI